MIERFGWAWDWAWDSAGDEEFSWDIVLGFWIGILSGCSNNHQNQRIGQVFLLPIGDGGGGYASTSS